MKRIMVLKVLEKKKEEGEVQLEEKNISTKEYKASLDKEELEKFNSSIDHLIFLNSVYIMFSQVRTPLRGIIIYFPIPKKEDKNDKMGD